VIDLSCWKVTDKEGGMTLLAFLREKFGPSSPFSVKALKRAIDGKWCTLNGKVEVFSSHRLKTGDRVKLDLAGLNPPQLQTGLPILYEDEDLLICNKPVGLVAEDPAFNAKLPQYQGRLSLVHRLDKETSGVIILAKNSSAKKAMIGLFFQREIHKMYMALVDGQIKGSKGRIDRDIGKKKAYQGTTIYQVVDKGKGESALTFWQCIRKNKMFSTLLCEPITGRTHQLRVHLSSIGHPILGDLTYGLHFRCPLTFKRHLLHAYSIAFTHPISKKEIKVIAPIPLDFKPRNGDWK
jgi:RluA family pseudouridine synthase